MAYEGVATIKINNRAMIIFFIMLRSFFQDLEFYSYRARPEITIKIIKRFRRQVYYASLRHQPFIRAAIIYGDYYRSAIPYIRHSHFSA